MTHVVHSSAEVGGDDDEGSLVQDVEEEEEQVYASDVSDQRPARGGPEVVERVHYQQSADLHGAPHGQHHWDLAKVPHQDL